MRLLALLALVLSTSAFAGEFAARKLSFSPRTFGGGTTHYYSCHFAEAATEARLTDLGATNVSVRCSGGIEFGWTMPVHVTAKYDVPVNGAATRAVTVKGNESCAFNSELMDAAVKTFPGVKVLKRSANCSGGRFDRWSYSLEITE